MKWCKDCKWYYKGHCSNGMSEKSTLSVEKYDSCKYAQEVPGKPGRQQQRVVYKLTHWDIDAIIKEHQKKGYNKCLNDVADALKDIKGVGDLTYKRIIESIRGIR